MAGILDNVDQRTQLAVHNRLELLLFNLGLHQQYGINVFKVKEVIQCPPLVSVPDSHHVVIGVAHMRGLTIPVMDLSLAVGGPALDDIENRYVIVTEYNRKVQGFLVGSVERIMNTNWEAILPPPKGVGDGSYLTAITMVDDRLVEIIDVEKVLKEVMDDEGELTEEMVKTDINLEDKHVLIVDDSVVARKQVKKVTDGIGISSTLACNGKEAYEQLLAWVEEGKDLNQWLTLVVSDVEMPQMDGYSLTTAIRKHDALKSLHVLLHTSLSGVFNNALVDKVGANGFIPKYNPQDLSSAILEQVKQHQARMDGGKDFRENI